MTLAPRLMPRLLRGGIRGAFMTLCLWQMPQLVGAEEIITDARFLGDTTVYAHGVLGDEVEYSVLRIDTEDTNGQRNTRSYSVFPDHVFEDIAPRLWDINDNPGPEVVVILTSLTQGASLAIFTKDGLLAHTPFIGRRNRWLAPIAAGDLDGDGSIEIAYIDRPHLAKTLRIWRLQENALVEVTSLTGLTNHRIGDDHIQSGLRDCGEGPELITADATWQNIMATRLVNARLTSRVLGRYQGRSSISAALGCN